MGNWQALVVVAIACAGCNQVFGLEATVPVSPDDPTADRDSDGILNADDNCANVANPLQEDGDRDETGDACDSCPAHPGSQHDEDLDGVGDRCDLCAAQRDPEQWDSDEDGVGDLCDFVPDPPVLITTKLVAFDAFETLDASWSTTGTAWQANQDAIVTVAQPGPNDPGLRGSLTIAESDFFVEIGVTALRALGPGDRVGIELVNAQGTPIVRCELACMTEQLGFNCGLAVHDGSGSTNTDFVSFRPAAQRRLRMVFYQGDVDCQFLLDGLLEDKGQMQAVPAAVSPVIHGSTGVAVTHFAAWTHQGI